MSYIVNKTDGSILTEIVDGTIDQTATDLTLIGKNASNYGEFFNENLVRLLENFASTSQPNNPIAGQLWFDTSEGRLKVYSGTGFKAASGTILSASAPTTIAAGDIWIDTTRKQLYFNDGVSTVLAGPVYSTQQGITGFQAVDVFDTNSISHTIVYLYVGQVLLGIFSKDSFTPAETIPGYSGSIEIGFNVGTHSGTMFNVPVSQANALSDNGELKTAASFISSVEDDDAIGTLSILNSTPLILGPGGTSGLTEIKLSNLNFQINSLISNQNFQVNLLANSATKTALHIDSQSESVGMYTTTPTATLDVNGTLAVSGATNIPLGFSIDATTKSNAQIAAVLEVIFPVSEHASSTICRVHCTNNNVNKRFRIISNSWTYEADL